MQKISVKLFANVVKTTRSALKAAYLHLLFFTGLLWWAKSRVAKSGALVLTLHRVVPDSEYDATDVKTGMVTKAGTFRRLLEYIQQRCFCIALDDMESPLTTGSGTHPPIAITFDDGWKDNFETALPIARKYGLPFTVFICPELIGGHGGAPIPKPPELLSWEDIRQMFHDGVRFGSHTSTHQILTRIPGNEVWKEITDSRNAIAAELESCSWLAYPNGDWSESVRGMVLQGGYTHAFANSPGIWKRNTDRFSIPRVNIWEGSLTGSNGRFSRVALEYAVFWKAYRASTN